MIETDSIVTAMSPMGMAVSDYMQGNMHELLVTERDDGYCDDMPVRSFFRSFAEMAPHEKAALEQCEGKILDIGAGTGPHSLVLQEYGRDVHAIDICPENVDAMKELGVKHADCLDIWDLTGKYDTLMLLGRGIGIVGNLEELENFLYHCQSLLNKNGQMLINGINFKQTDFIKHIRYQQRNRKAHRFEGISRIRLKYKDLTGPWFNWLLVDYDTLKTYAIKAGWQIKILEEEPDGNYLAGLTL